MTCPGSLPGAGAGQWQKRASGGAGKGSGQCAGGIRPRLGRLALEMFTRQADVKVQLDPALLKKITDDALENSLHTTVTVRGSAQVEAIFGVRLNCRMECDIRASVTEIFGENKQAVVESKSCTYKYF